jgi:hypothetical protein
MNLYLLITTYPFNLSCLSVYQFMYPTIIHPSCLSLSHLFCFILSIQTICPIACLSELVWHALFLFSCMILMYNGSHINARHRCIWQPQRVYFWEVCSPASGLLNLALASVVWSKGISAVQVQPLVLCSSCVPSSQGWNFLSDSVLPLS